MLNYDCGALERMGSTSRSCDTIWCSFHGCSCCLLLLAHQVLHLCGKGAKEDDLLVQSFFYFPFWFSMCTKMSLLLLESSADTKAEVHWQSLLGLKDFSQEIFC